MVFTKKVVQISTAVSAALVLCLPMSSLGQEAVSSHSNRPFWSITPYIWASDTELSVTVKDSDISGDVSIPFDDLLDIVESSFQIHIEGGHGQWSGFADITVLATSDTVERSQVTIDTDSEQTFVDAAIAYWPGGVGSSLSVFGGVRFTDFASEYAFSDDSGPLPALKSASDYYDALFGVRYGYDFSERWGLLTRADVSFGDTEGTYLLRGLLTYRVGKRRMNRIVLGYQYKAAEFIEGAIRQDFEYYGPMAGFNMRF